MKVLKTTGLDNKYMRACGGDTGRGQRVKKQFLGKPACQNVKASWPPCQEATHRDTFMSQNIPDDKCPTFAIVRPHGTYLCLFKTQTP